MTHTRLKIDGMSNENPAMVAAYAYGYCVQKDTQKCAATMSHCVRLGLHDLEYLLPQCGFLSGQWEPPCKHIEGGFGTCPLVVDQRSASCRLWLHARA